jgi:phospholipase/carboxylesterase
MIEMAALQVTALTRNYDALATHTPAGLPEVERTLEAFLTELAKELGTTTERMVLGGFSQGAMLATDTVLAGRLRFAGLAVVSGTLLSRARWTSQVAACQGCPVFQSHGREDPILPFPLADELRKLFEAAGAKHTWVPFSGGHAIPPPVIAGLGAFFRDTLG